MPVYGSGGFTTYDEKELVEQVLNWVDGQGIGRGEDQDRRVLGHGMRRDLDRSELARKRMGDAELYVDANGGYTAKQAIRVAAERPRTT